MGLGIGGDIPSPKSAERWNIKQNMLRFSVDLIHLKLGLDLRRTSDAYDMVEVPSKKKNGKF